MNTLLKPSSTQDTPLNNTESANELENANHLIFTTSLPDPPTDHCFAIDEEGRLLIGAYPRDLEEIKRLVEHGNVGCFVNLTSDRRYESWFGDQCLNKVKILYRPLPRRNFVGDDTNIVSIAREIRQWLHNSQKQSRIYVHSELGYGRAGVVASVLLGDLLNLQATDAIQLLQNMRATMRKDYAEEKIVPIVETNEQVQQVFRLLGNPQVDSNGNREEANFSIFDEESTSNGGKGDAISSVRFVDLEGAGTDADANDKSLASRFSADNVEDGESPFGRDLEYAPLPDRSDTFGWMKVADIWIKTRKKDRKTLTSKLNQEENSPNYVKRQRI